MADLYTEARKRADETIDEQAILDKYNAATVAQYNAQREQNRINENKFYDQMYNTQRTAMDTIRQSNAAAVASGASRGVQAAQELSSLLGLQQESVTSATELAQANRQTAQEETAAVLENVLNAYKEAEAAKQQAVTQEIAAEQVVAEKAAAAATNERTNQDALQSALETSTEAYLAELANQGKDYTTYSTEGVASLEAATKSITTNVSGEDALSVYNADDWKGNATGANKTSQVEASLKQLIKAYGLTESNYTADIEALKEWASKGYNWVSGHGFGNSGSHWNGKTGAARIANEMYNDIIARMKTEYANKAIQ